ncbi:hypothetical protein GQ43DRAFT_373900 [Delitschia confertaspora ATCC 74209]|uniref:Exonuclease domain-containing protein n=1 Tax=Delitschia confertaspora ATCC 74209 TaxID=1513339 RepID=A0A9P4JJT6_9PLEO|nr:hypothetical protein GQ43DRAFT_373900 [Delitschia confertaspora ATCC 74209]
MSSKFTTAGGVGRPLAKVRKTEPKEKAASISPSCHLEKPVTVRMLQEFALFLLSDGYPPKWLSIKEATRIQRVVMLMVPGLEMAMFEKNADWGLLSDSSSPDLQQMIKKFGADLSIQRSENDHQPKRLLPADLHAPLQPLAAIFTHVWPVLTEEAGSSLNVASPAESVIYSPIQCTWEEKSIRRHDGREGQAEPPKYTWVDKPTPITNFIATLEQQQTYDNPVIHPAWYTTPETKAQAYRHRKETGTSVEDGWLDTRVKALEDGNVSPDEVDPADLTAGRDVLAIDCEMCLACDDTMVLTRVSLVDWDGKKVLDEFVKPEVRIKNYLTQYSGITEEDLKGVRTTLSDIQQQLLQIITPRTLLIGHSIDSDLAALKLTHPFLVDTTLLYPHPHGLPSRQGLKFLAKKYLDRDIQRHTEKGHDSIEDALAALDLVREKCNRGAAWGTSMANSEPITQRLARTRRPNCAKSLSEGHMQFRAGTLIDWSPGVPGSIACRNDAEVVHNVQKVIEDDVQRSDFVWARLQELEVRRGWWSADYNPFGPAPVSDPVSLEAAVTVTVQHVANIYHSLPKGTAFVVYSGTGNPVPMMELRRLKRQFNREFKRQLIPWDDLSIQWTSNEDQALRHAVDAARKGVSFVGIK